MRDSGSGILSMRGASLVESREDIRRVWDRISALALDFIQNSGRLKGAVDQVLADTVGTELKLNAKPDLSKLGYSAEETTAFAKLVEERWRQWAWSPAECDQRGKFTVPQMVDIALRWQIAYGEATGVIGYMTPAQRRGYGIESGVKVCMVTPTRLVRDTSEIEGMFAGVIHDTAGRPVAYRFQERQTGFEVKKDYPARDRDGRPVVIHVFDPVDAADVRGISVIASALRTYANSERLEEVTLATAILQTVFAATLTSPNPSADAFEALESLTDEKLKTEMTGYLQSRLDVAAESKLTIGDASQVNHLAPGETLQLHTAATPGAQYVPFKAGLDRDMARAIGITYESYSMDFVGATYSSVRMGNSSIWPVVLRRRERIAAPICQSIYENWLDEEIGEGRIPLRGGYRAFRANRAAVTWAEWRGPAKPSADDYKSARAQTERLQNGTSTLEVECAENGLDWRDVIKQRGVEREACLELGLADPFVRVTGGGPAKEGEAEEAPAQREKADA